jgi:hypothetical protein
MEPFHALWGTDNSDQWVDWSIGNGVPFNSYGFDDIVFSTKIVSFIDPADWKERMRITKDGSIGIGTTSPVGRLDVNRAIYQRVRVLHADYVFELGYKLESIDEHSEFMWMNKHLKAIPKAQVDENGVQIVEAGSHRKGIVEELEKAHIYIQQMHTQIREPEAEGRQSL